MSSDHVNLETTHLEKDLGINVDPELKFSKHVEIQVNKANKILGLIRRSYDYMDGEILKYLYVSLVRPHLEFGNAVWSPRLIKDKNLIENVQRRATKLVPDFKDIPYEERLKRLKLPSMCYRRSRGDMIECYKYTHGQYLVNQDLLPRDIDGVTRGHNLKLKKRFCNTTVRHSFFSFRVVDTWNKLPPKVVNAPTLNSFKNRLDKLWSKSMYETDL